jgi:hypothetical protein
MRSIVQAFMAALFFLTSGSVLAQNGSAYLNCNGYVRLCPSCSSSHFTIYTYQYAYVVNSKVIDEYHKLNMSGLGDASLYKVQTTAAARHILYSNGIYQLAVPFLSSTDGIWIRGEKHDGQASNSWILLCAN